MLLGFCPGILLLQKMWDRVLKKGWGLKQMGPLIFVGDVDSGSTNGKLVVWDMNPGAPK